MAGGPKGKLRCYAEVPFKVRCGAKTEVERPDGIIQVTRGKTQWTALVEAKVGDQHLEQDQFDCYHGLARDQGIDAVITISNRAALPNGLPPGLKIDRRRLRSVPVTHLSWERLLSEAQVLSRREEIADQDQQWMLEEWVRYVADPQSRIIEPPQFGEHWNEVVRAAREGNLIACKREVRDVVKHWDAFLRKVALSLRAKLGVDVEVKIPRAERSTPELRLKRLQAIAVDSGELPGVLRVPDAAGDVSVAVLLPSNSVQYSIQVDGPTEGRAKTRINWLLKQLSKDVPGDLVIKVHWDRRKLWSQGRISELDKEIDTLLRDNNGEMIPRDSLPRAFSLEWTTRLTKGRGRSTAPVLEGVARGIEDFYGRVVEGLQRYVPRAPQLPPEQPRVKDEDADTPSESEA